MKVRVVSTSLWLLLLAGCGSESLPDGASTDTANGSTAAASENETPKPDTEHLNVKGLTCSTDARSVGTLDFFGDAGGTETAEAAARVIAEPSDGVVLQQQSVKSAVAYVLRPNETAYMRLDLVTLSDGTWRVETVESCPGEGLGD
jgi:hypothetical protein